MPTLHAMQFVLSPAKTLAFESPVPAELLSKLTRPAFAASTTALITELKRKTPAQVAALMDLSDGLAALNVARYRSWRKRATPTNARPALLAFKGDVYAGLDAPSLSTDDVDWAQQHLLMLSGLYGILRPLDLMQPYRLEMGTTLATEQGADLYAFWGARLAQVLDTRAAADATPIIVNLASQEYFRAVPRKALRARVIDCVFEDWKSGGYKIISFFAKRARGMLARQAIQERWTLPAQLAGFNRDGYAFVADASTPARWVFRRRFDEA